MTKPAITYSKMSDVPMEKLQQLADNLRGISVKLDGVGHSDALDCDVPFTYNVIVSEPMLLIYSMGMETVRQLLEKLDDVSNLDFINQARDYIRGCSFFKLNGLTLEEY